MSDEKKIPLEEYLKKEHESVFEGFRHVYDLYDALVKVVKSQEKRIKELEKQAYERR